MTLTFDLDATVDAIALVDRLRLTHPTLPNAAWGVLYAISRRLNDEVRAYLRGR